MTPRAIPCRAFEARQIRPTIAPLDHVIQRQPIARSARTTPHAAVLAPGPFPMSLAISPPLSREIEALRLLRQQRHPERRRHHAPRQSLDHGHTSTARQCQRKPLTDWHCCSEGGAGNASPKGRPNASAQATPQLPAASYGGKAPYLLRTNLTQLTFQKASISARSSYGEQPHRPAQSPAHDAPAPDATGKASPLRLDDTATQAAAASPQPPPPA